MHAPSTVAGPVPSFAELGVPESLVEVLRTAGIREPFAIQTAAIGPALDGRDVLGRAPTGSGKTLAFGIPMATRLGAGAKRRPSGLILAPTRELADQIARELEPLLATRDRRVATIYGGVGFGAQLTALRNGVDLIVACPGRLEDLISQKEIDLSQVHFVVVDEADRMADMGFLPAVRRLLDLTSHDRQTVLFSATLDSEVKVLTDNYQNDPVVCEVGEAEPDLSTMTHRFIRTEKESKIHLAADVIDAAGPTVMFCRTRHGVDRAARQLKRLGVKAGWIHGGRTQRQRDAALEAFTDEKVQVLVATDVAARGIHVDGVACVIHFDPPADPKDYVHRSGRTARAGAAGEVVSFLNSDQVRAASKLQKQVGIGPIEIEATPELSARKTLAWVDQRSAKNGGSKGGGSKNRSGGGNGQKRSGAREDGRAKARKRADGSSRPDGGAPTSGGASKGGGGPAAGGADDRTSKRSGKPRPKRKKGGSAGSRARSGGGPRQGGPRQSGR